MYPMIVVDTDILIDVARGIDNAVSFFQQQQENVNQSLAISIVTKMELIVGCRDKKELIITENFLEQFTLLNINEQSSKI